ncbi:MAG: hypothetical protein KDE68_13015 [Rhodocyclaceae bacterium]|nr:hypothetical protein [Rhodocyclaceae bacterium]
MSGWLRLCCVGVLSMLAPAVHAGPPLDAEAVEWVNRFADEMAQRCEARFEARLADGESDLNRLGLIEMERRVNCECLPTRLRVYATAELVTALQARQLGPSRAFMTQHARVCGAQGLRDSAMLNCRIDLQEAAFAAARQRPPTPAERATLPPLDAAQQAQCDCYAQGVEQLDDDALIAAIEEDNAARRDGPTAGAQASRLATLMQACQTGQQ